MPRLTRRELASGQAQMSCYDGSRPAVVLRAFKFYGKLRYRIVCPDDNHPGEEFTIYPPDYHLAQKWFDLECAKRGR